MLSGKDIEVNEEIKPKLLSDNVSKLVHFERSTVFKSLQLENACLPINVNVDGKEIFVIPEQPENAHSAICVRSLGSEIFPQDKDPTTPFSLDHI